MLDKKHDGFFDEESADDRKSGELMAMLGSYDKKIKTFAAGDKVSGKVTRIAPEYVYIDIGAKNEAMIKTAELDGDGVKVGDTVVGFVVSDRDGETVVSKSAGGGGGVADLSALREALDARMPVQGKVTGVNKNGLIVKIMGHRSFCPISQIDVRYTSDVNEYLNKTLDFVITRITEGGKNIVVSRVPLFEAGLEDKFKKFADAAGSNKVFKGKVSKVAEFGLFIEIGGLEGLVHISEVSWQRAQNLSESFAVGQEVEFVVLKVERKETLRNSKISLSIKQALEDPWKKVADSVTVGETISGRITRLANFGAFVEVIPGVEGLIHVSELDWTRQRVHHPSEIVAPGQEVKATVLGIDHNKKSISLTLKNEESDPWNGIEEKLAVGADVTGKVARKTKFGYFVDLFEGVTGLLVFARMADDKKDSLKPGDSVTVQVESIDTEARRVALSMGVSDNRKETEETKQYLKKQDAKPERGAAGGGAPSDTAMGAALLAAGFKKPKPAAKPAAAQKAAPVQTASTTTAAAAVKPATMPTASAAPVVDKPSSASTESVAATPSKSASVPTVSTAPEADKPAPVSATTPTAPAADESESVSTKKTAETPPKPASASTAP
jgi:small subunit ribosomal protein S1